MNNDLISRQAVLEEIISLDFVMSKCLTIDECRGMGRARDMIIDCVKNVPSVQLITPCDLCRYSPPSVTDNKPCVICPAVRRKDE